MIILGTGELYGGMFYSCFGMWCGAIPFWESLSLLPIEADFNVHRVHDVLPGMADGKLES